MPEEKVPLHQTMLELIEQAMTQSEMMMLAKLIKRCIGAEGRVKIISAWATRLHDLNLRDGLGVIEHLLQQQKEEDEGAARAITMQQECEHYYE
jgi:hypothetical protein